MIGYLQQQLSFLLILAKIPLPVIEEFKQKEFNQK